MKRIKQPISISQGVIHVMSRLKPGDTLLSCQIYKLVVPELHRYGYVGTPNQESVQRKFRKVADLCEMETVPEGFRKRIPLPPITEDEKAAKQQMLFS